MKAKKSFGQHFLTRKDIGEKIAQSLELTDCETILEVGPGKGFLTQFLLEHQKELILVEADRDMAAYLRNSFPGMKATLVESDFLKVDLKTIVGEKPFALIGNYPYNISSQIVFKMLEYKEQIPEMAGMFQKEVAERIVAGPGSKTYGVLSVLVQAFYEGEYLFTVDKSAFQPPPKVQSGVIHLKRKENQDLGCNYKIFKKIVKSTFAQRRKMLRNTLQPFLEKEELMTDPFYQKRPEQLSVEDFVSLANKVNRLRTKIDSSPKK